MLIFATLGINILAIVIWSVKNNANGFVEVGKLLRGEPAFLSVPQTPGQAGSGAGGESQQEDNIPRNEPDNPRGILPGGHENERI